MTAGYVGARAFGFPIVISGFPPPLYKDLDPPLKRADCILEQLAAR